jgi:Domain of unknown function (DUF3472)/Domain of unknown function (DUF5077)
MKNIIWLIVIILFQISCISQNKIPKNKKLVYQKTIPIGGNGWVTQGDSITDEGLINWKSPSSVCKIHFRVNQTGKLKLSLFLNTNNSKSTINVHFLNKNTLVSANSASEQEFLVGEFDIEKAGYLTVELQGISKTGAFFGDLSKIAVSGSAVSDDLVFVQNNDDNYFYWGRRGPSVHLNFPTEKTDSIEWFYSEINVPTGNDVVGSYFMANGFSEGYFGFQVNSATERRILFSVWSPFQTDDPDLIPKDEQIVALKKGEKVHLGAFGNEGSGGQSYLVFPWKAGETYRFLLRGQPIGDNFTIFTAYFFAPETQKWQLIASFKRPKTHSFLTNLHSFLENFEPETGEKQRMAFYQNQWVRNHHGKWSELTETQFTADQTARKNFRKDFAGGVENGQFFLKNAGFFDDFVGFDQNFSRPARGKKPEIDFLKLD